MEDKLKGVIFLLVFWSFFIGISIFFSPVFGIHTNADINNMDSANYLNIDSIAKLMTFQVEGSFPLFIALILDSLAIFTLVLIFLVIVK